MRPLLIAHVLPSFQIGGQERVALDLSRVQRARGDRVLAFSIDGRPEGSLAAAFRAAGVETRAMAKGPRVDPTLVLRLAARFARAGVDVVHTHNPMALTYGAPAGKLAGAVVVHTKHGENLEAHGRRLAKLIPDARHEEVGGTRAFIPEDQPERLAELIRDFVPAGVRAPA